MSIADISDLFGKLDKNHNGLVSQKEIKAYLKSNSTKYNNKEVREFVSKIDDNSDGQISLEELTKALSGNLDISKVPDEVRCIFNEIDKNHNGFVTNRELSSYFRKHHAKFNRNEVKGFICKLDSDGDGQISLPELTRALTGRY
ncbi:unnamed protein product [Schistosoma margrebowiei]|uniref:Uncharacterized protein n=1 Tax=Schistosoma margrebowiei TaxID=48269 RepID=A0A183MPU7_9TREM|nr:unnamed protein product [Schistosoma margrebowiei]